MDKGEIGRSRDLRILTINRHTGYLYNLSKIGHHWSVLNSWAHHNRPLPANFESLDWQTARHNFQQFDAVIGHDIRRDLTRFVPYCIRHRKPYIQVIHGRRGTTGFSKVGLRRLGKRLYSSIVLRPLARLNLVHFVFLSTQAHLDWSMKGTVINQGVPLDEMGRYEGTEPSLLVVGNELHRVHFAFDELLRIKSQVPVAIFGENPRIRDCRPAQNWAELRSTYCRYRAYLYIAREPENGLAVLEAMASGMPVISFKHDSTPVRNGENGFLVDDAAEAVERAKQLIANPELAQRLGTRARETVAQRFSIDILRTAWNRLLSASISRD